MTCRLLLTSFLLGLLACVAGCAGDSGGTPEEARTELYGALDEAQAALGGEWENRDDPTPRGCSLPLWMEGETYPALRIGPMPEDVPDTLITARATLEELGYRVEGSEVGDVAELKGTGAGSALVIFRITGEGMTLQGESACRPVGGP